MRPLLTADLEPGTHAALAVGIDRTGFTVVAKAAANAA
jgi:hypothetical protein